MQLYRVWRSGVNSPNGAQRKSNLVHFILTVRHLVAAILLIFHFYLHKREAPLRREAQVGGLARLPKGRYCIFLTTEVCDACMASTTPGLQLPSYSRCCPTIGSLYRSVCEQLARGALWVRHCIGARRSNGKRLKRVVYVKFCG